MGLADWLRVFRALHEKAKKGELSGTDAEDYRAGCDELSRALIAAQKLGLRPGEVPRRVLRVARAGARAERAYSEMATSTRVGERRAARSSGVTPTRNPRDPPFT